VLFFVSWLFQDRPRRRSGVLPVCRAPMAGCRTSCSACKTSGSRIGGSSARR
jgi:hypothetical protein